ncbi:MAG TPA: POTRA domain-containing protein, partial [Candidatus Saccharimonadales bacterium]|nr:POTRA domain-containing protein [Candidatus Saccharimonadales bacterium]
MKQGLRLGLALWLGTLTAFGQQAPVRPTLDREVEGKAQKALQPPPKVQAPGTEAAAQPAEAEDELKVDFLYGVVVLTDRALLKVEGVPRGKPVQVPESDPLLNSKEFKELILRHCQKPMSTRLMNQLLHEIIQFYHAHGHMLVDVLYEPQDISNGMLQITVLEGKLKQIKLQDKEGRPYTNGLSNPAVLRNSLHLKEDQPVLRRDVYADLDWLNRNPFRKVQPVFEPGGGFAQSDLLLRIEERRPIEFLAGYENTGSEVTGENRIFAGITWGKAFGIQDHIFNYQFTASPDFEGLRAHVASYTML